MAPRLPTLAAALALLLTAPALAGGLLPVPVEGVAHGDLRDTWGEARAAGREHQGIDIPAPIGTPVLAVRDGRVAKLFLSKPGGVTLYLIGPDGVFIYYYAHLQRYAEGIAEGGAVTAGQVIAYVGDTGNTRIPHLHFEIGLLEPPPRWWVSTPLNPYWFLVPLN